MNKTQTS